VEAELNEPPGGGAAPLFVQYVMERVFRIIHNG